MSKEWPLWEIFIRSQHSLAHKHAGSLHAPDAEMAVNNARDVYTRRNEGISIWVGKAADIPATRRRYSSHPTARYIGIRPSSRCQKKSKICKPVRRFKNGIS